MPKSRLIVALFIIGSVCSPLAISAQESGHTLFTNVTEEARVSFYHLNTVNLGQLLMGTGAAWFDYNNDGHLDLYVTQFVGYNKLFRNNGDGTFTDVALALGADDVLHVGGGVAVADFNNDGWSDLYLANADADVLLKNNAGTGFIDMTNQAGFDVREDGRGNTAAWGDYNNDGFLDLYVTNHMHLNGPGPRFNHQDRLFLNNGHETFTDVSDLIGADLLNGYGFAATWTDFDNDSDLDIIQINDCPYAPDQGDYLPTLAFRNDGGTNPLNWTFTEVSAAIGMADCRNGMGIAIGDYNRDGWMDYYYSNIGRAILLENREGSFEDATDVAGVGITEPGDRTWWTWGGNFLDFNLDGWLDLYVDAGARHDTAPITQLLEQPNFLFQSDANGQSFTDVSPQSGVNDPGLSRTSVFGDYDADGDPDLFVVNTNGDGFLYRNEHDNDNPYLIVDLEGTTSNRDGIGARLTLTTPDGKIQTYETRSGSSLGGGDDRAAYFGLGSDTYAESLHIRWPSGIEQVIESVQGNQRLTITEPATSTFITVNTRVFLHGPYTDGAMNTALNQAGWLPTTPPFEDSIRLIPTDSVTADLFATHPQIVDWIRVSLRRDRAAVTTVATRAGFLTDSGLVVDMDGTSPLTFPGIPPGSYYIVIEHVNHLGVMTTERIALGPRSELLDLTNDPARIYQGVIKDLGNGFYGLYGGDATGDGCLYYVGPNRDVLPILDLLGIENANGSVEGYFPADMNLDGLVAHTGPNSDQSVLIDALGPDNLSGIICTAVPAFINKAGASIRLIDAPNMNLRF